MGGAAIRDALNLGESFDAVWHMTRWPLGVALVVTSVALLFRYCPRRRQPEASWLAFGAGVSALLFLLFMGVLAAYMDATDSFGSTYVPIARARSACCSGRGPVCPSRARGFRRTACARR